MKSEGRIADNLAAAVKADGRAPRAIALAAGLNHTAIRDILTGKTNSPRADTLERLAAAMNVPLATLTRGEQPLDSGLAELLGQLTEAERLKAEGYIRALLDSRPAKQ